MGQWNLHAGLAFQRVAAGLVVMTGLAAEVFERSQGPHVKVHFLFGLMLGLAVVGRFSLELWTRRPTFEKIQAFARTSTRMVYALLYGLLSVKLALNLIVDNLTPPETYQPYLASGVIAIVLIRALAILSASRFEFINWGVWL